MSMLKMDGFDDCIAGIVVRANQPDTICYDTEKVVTKLIERDGMTLDEAIEFFQFNQLNAWVGEGTPCFLREATDEDFEE